MSKSPLSLDDIQSAAARLSGLSVKTPLLEHPVLNVRAGGRVLLKAENLQRVGAFKFRGAYNAVSRIDEAEFPGGVVAASSGNHAQGIAASAGLCGISAAIVMPSDAPALKVQRTRAFGAEVALYDRANGDRINIAEELARERKAHFVHPFDDLDVMAGQGTVGIELMVQAAEQCAAPAVVLVPTAGGGLLSGIATAVKAANASTTVHSVEPARFDDFSRSLADGQRVQNAVKTGSICDAPLVDMPGVRTFDVARRLCGQGLVVSDEEVTDAIRFAFLELKQVVEPGGAVALAALLSGKIDAIGMTVVVVLSGGNVDPALFSEIIVKVAA